jgi:ribosomal protein S18 acetylase RimI-like enzyme
MTIASVGLEPAKQHSLESLAELLNDSFSGYAIKMRETSFDLARRVVSDGIELGTSAVALDESRELVGLCLTGQRKETYRIAAMGVVPASRRRGIARRLMQHALDEARAGGATRLLLEVFEHNAAARGLYESMGFVTRRRLVGFTLDETRVRATRVPAPAARSLVEVSHLDVAWALREQGTTDLPWQMQPEAIAELGPPCRAFSLGGRAFVLLRETREGVLSLRGLSVAPAARGRGIGRLFVDALRSRFPQRKWRVAPRVPEGLADRFFLGMGFERMELVQLEMELPLAQKTGTG